MTSTMKPGDTMHSMWKQSSWSFSCTQPQSVDMLSWYTRNVAIRPNSKWETSSASTKTSKDAQASNILQRCRTLLCTLRRMGSCQSSSSTVFSASGMTSVKATKMPCTSSSHASPSFPSVTPTPRPTRLYGRTRSGGSSISVVRTPDVVTWKDVTRAPTMINAVDPSSETVTATWTSPGAWSRRDERTLGSAGSLELILMSLTSSRWSSEAACPRTSDITVATTKAKNASIGTGSTKMLTSVASLCQPIL
mmetsp:Transcript_69721/g.179766  ORF Transcript_69721/g.179766 Transcript_69721/m.179766 type:complete len:250 (+) Transcript_69721:242-991(+)